LLQSEKKRKKTFSRITFVVDTTCLLLVADNHVYYNYAYNINTVSCPLESRLSRYSAMYVSVIVPSVF